MSGNQPIIVCRADTYGTDSPTAASSASNLSGVQQCCRLFPSLSFSNSCIHSRLADPSMGMFGMLAALLLHAVACQGMSYRLTASSSISGNQTLISYGVGDFALGFFIPNKSTGKRYLGIWDNKIPGKSVVWVANGQSPLTDASAGVVTVTEDGNLAVLNADGTAIWSSGLAPSNATTFAELLDTGNLILKRVVAARGGIDTVWQSFDHPTNTWLPEMKLWLDTKTGESVRLVSWRGDQDPSPGDFSVGIDPISMLQFKIWRRGTETVGRSDIWNGRSISADLQGVTDTVVVQQMNLTGGRWLSLSFSLTKGSPPARAVLLPSGVPYILFWLPSTEMWIRSPPPLACWYYNRCGPNAVCESNVTVAKMQPYCQCLPGFVPAARQEWDKGNYSKGCTRRVPLPCNKNKKGFRSMERVKLPDEFRLVMDANEEQCLDECLRNCNCTAYSYSNVSVLMSSSRCLVWTGDLNDLIYYKSEPTVQGVFDKGSSLYIRLPVSEMATQQTIALTRKRSSVVLAITLPVIVIGMLLSVALACILTTRLRGRGRRQHALLDDLKTPKISGNNEHKTMSKLLDFGSLQDATNNFSLDNRLGEGGFGPVYKGKLHGGQEVAIKRLSKCSSQGFQEFSNEVEVIARLQHTNLVRLLGWCIHAKEKILIYEYMPNKSLDKFLFDPTRNEELTWPRRFNIIQGIAQGLIYLHRYSRLRIIHRDMKSSNILLDVEMNPKISDFGLARIIAKNQSEGITKRVVGTVGYMSPEYAFDGLFSEKSDVFAFGVIILEIVTGKRSKGCYLYSNETRNLLGFVWEHWKDGKCLDLVDSCIRRHFSPKEVTKCIQIGLLCTQERAFDRPTMASVISMLDTQSVALPSPNQPAFSAQRYDEVDDSQCESYILCSINVTVTCGEENVLS